MRRRGEGLLRGKLAPAIKQEGEGGVEGRKVGKRARKEIERD